MQKSTTRCLSRSAAIASIMFLLAISLAAAQPSISEIMFNPQGSDTGREWIEIESNQTLNLTEYILFEDNTNHRIYACDGNETNNTDDAGYSIITSDCAKFTQDYAGLQARKYKSSFSLSNTGEYLSIRLSGETVDEVNYSQYTPYNSTEGDSLQKNNSAWVMSLPTPGYAYQDILANESAHSTLNTTQNITLNESSGNSTITPVDMNGSVIINDTSINTSINDTYYNETIHNDSVQNESTYNETEICNISITIILRNSTLSSPRIYQNKESIKFYNRIVTQGNGTIEAFDGVSYSIEYWIEDIAGNIMKPKIMTANQQEKSYTPDISEKDRVLIIRNRIAGISINGTALCNNISAESAMIVIVMSPSYSEKQCSNSCPKTSKATSQPCIIKTCNGNPSMNITPMNSSINISSIRKLNESHGCSDGAISFKASIYRGDDRKSVVEARIVDKNNKSLSEAYRFRMLAEGSSLELDAIICMDECDKAYLVIEGLGSHYREQIECPAGKNVSKNVPPLSLVIKENRVENATQRTVAASGQTIVYESPSQKSKFYSLLGLMLLVLAGGAYLIYRVVLHKLFKPQQEQ